MKTQEEIEQQLKKLKSDGRLAQPPATIEINAPLALIQTDLEAKIEALTWVLK